MNYRFTLALYLGIGISPVCVADNDIKNQLNHCHTIKDNNLRLNCFDQINPSDNTADSAVNENSNKTNMGHSNVFPSLLADLDEPNLAVSYGNLDLLGSAFNAVLLSGGKRQKVKDFKLNNDNSLSFNVFGQIRSQFDVNELDTRNNRGGALINTDFSVGGELVQSLAHWNWRFSYTHKSTHLGDEFIIDNHSYLLNRINLSYETIRWTAHKPINNWDFYAGLGFITRSEPGNLAKTMWQSGWQFQGEARGLFGLSFKPVWAVDLKSWGAYDWNINANMRAGFEVQNLTQLPFQLLFEYQDGQSPYGQFYTEDLTFIGLSFLQNW